MPSIHKKINNHDQFFSRPVTTYSIVAYDPNSRELGVAVQSHWFSVGSIVPWAEAGVGAVATQSFVDPSYGPLGLALLQKGKSPQQALKALLAGDPQSATRQVAIIDTEGQVAVHTGSRCIAEAGHAKGEFFSVQANMMRNDRVWPEMKQAYDSAEGDLTDRLLSTLEAAETAGGDIRGKQSAALLVVRGASSGRSWVDKKVDLRIEDHANPVEELKRLVRIDRAYKHANRGDELAAEGNISKAKKEYQSAASLAPDIIEFTFWEAVALAFSERFEEAKPLFEKTFKKEPRWRRLVRRLPQVGLLPDDKELIEEITELGT